MLEFARESPDVLSAQDAKVHLESASKATVVDVCNGDEFVSGTLRGAINVPLPDIADGYAAGLLPEDKHAPVVTLCKVGERSLHALLLLEALGYRDVRSIKGGINAWREAGLPTTA